MWVLSVALNSHSKSWIVKLPLCLKSKTKVILLSRLIRVKGSLRKLYVPFCNEHTSGISILNAYYLLICNWLSLRIWPMLIWDNSTMTWVTVGWYGTYIIGLDPRNPHCKLLSFLTILSLSLIRRASSLWLCLTILSSHAYRSRIFAGWMYS